jgi:hypothetical protein
VLALRHFEELSNSEAAKVLNMSEQATSGRYLRALGRLKDILQVVPGFLDDHSPYGQTLREGFRRKPPADTAP